MLRQLRPLAPPLAAGMILLLFGTRAVGHPPTESEKPGLIPLKDDGWCHAFSPDGRTMATTVHLAPGSWLVRLRDCISGAILAETEAGSEYPRYMTFSPDGRRLALVAWTLRLDKPPFLIRYWDITAAKRLANAHVLRLDYSLCGRRTVFHCAFSPDGKALAAATGREVVYVWETATGQLRRRFQGGVAAGFSADGQTLIAVTHDGLVRRFAFPACKLIVPDESVPRTDFLYVTQVAFSPDGQFVAQSDDRTTVVKEVGTGRTAGRLLVEGVMAHSFSADGKTLAVLADDGTHFLDLSTGVERAWLRREDGLAEFFPGGKYLACRGDKAFVFREIADVFFRARRRPLSPRRTRRASLWKHGWWPGGRTTSSTLRATRRRIAATASSSASGPMLSG